MELLMLEIESFVKKPLAFLVSILLVCLIPALGSAAIKIKIKPMITVGASYNNNFYKTDKNKLGVLTVSAQPGVQFGFETGKTSVLFNYTLEGYLYNSVSGKQKAYGSSSDLNYLGHLAALNMRYMPTDRLTFVLDDSFYLTRYPVYYDRLSEQIDWGRYYINRLTPGVFYDFVYRTTAGLRYRWTEVHYLDSDPGYRYRQQEVHRAGFGAGDYNDTTEHSLLFNLLYNPTRTTTLDLDYQIWWMDYHHDEWDDYTSNQVKLVFQKRHTYFAFDVGIGWNHRAYYDSEVDDEGTFAWKVSGVWQNPPPPESRRYLGKLFLRPQSSIYMAAESNFSRYGPLFTGYRFTLDTRHVFFDKISARIKGWYQISDFEDYMGVSDSGDLVNRKDYAFDISGTLAFLFTDRLSLGVTVGHREVLSNLAGYGYEDDYMIFNFGLNFDIVSRGGYTKEVLYY